jgi:hypothetical protein
LGVFGLHVVAFGFFGSLVVADFIVLAAEGVLLCVGWPEDS